MKNYKTPIEKVLFRSSKIGLLAGGLIRHGLTATMNDHMKELQVRKDDACAKPLTPKMQETLQAYIDKKNKPPELSEGAKTYIKEVWLKHEKGFEEDISSKYLKKGIQSEEDAINLISFVDGQMYIKNEERVTNGHISGECDIKHFNKEHGAKIIDDTKCCWNPKTFMAAKNTTGYEWQGRSYLYLYNADIFRLRFCLVDCPPDVLQDELKKFCWQNNIIDPDLPEYRELIDQFHANFLYEHSGNYTQEERVKTFMLSRDYNLEAVLLKSVELGVEYYKTITLNMIE